MDAKNRQSKGVRAKYAQSARMTTVVRIVSGGQTGADRGGLDAAIALGLEHGGWCPRGRRAEDGCIPEWYQLKETLSASYLPRTERNVRDSDGTVVLTMGPMSPGSWKTIQFAKAAHRPFVHIALDVELEPAAKLRQWCEEHHVVTMNVAGSRESKAPGIQTKACDVIIAAFTRHDRPGT